MTKNKIFAFAVILLLVANIAAVFAEDGIPSGDNAESNAVSQTQTALKGDLNLDGKVNPVDMQLMTRYLFITFEAPTSMANADMNNDSNVDIADVTILIQNLKENGYFVDNYLKGDLNKDGDITPTDLDLMVDYLFVTFEHSFSLEAAQLDNIDSVDIADLTTLILWLKDLGYLTDNIAPTINLIGPSNGYKFETSSSHDDITFRYKVSDESSIASCKLIIDGNVEDTITNPSKDVTLSFSERLDEGSYDWKISCTDSSGNTGDSEVRSFRIKQVDDSNNNANTQSTNEYQFGGRIATPTVTPQDSGTATITIATPEKTGFNWTYALIGILAAMIILIIIMIVVLRR